MERGHGAASVLAVLKLIRQYSPTKQKPKNTPVVRNLFASPYCTTLDAIKPLVCLCVAKNDRDGLARSSELVSRLFRGILGLKQTSLV